MGWRNVIMCSADIMLARYVGEIPSNKAECMNDIYRHGNV